MATLRPMAAAIAASSSASASEKEEAICEAWAILPATPDTLSTAPLTLPATAETLPTLLATPASLPTLTVILGDGTWKQCRVMSMFARAAREPPMYTFDDPVIISNKADNGGTTPQQVGFSP